MLFDELDVAHQWRVEIIIIGSVLRLERNCTHHIFYQSEREKMKWLQDC